jgi:hypothetical protein
MMMQGRYNREKGRYNNAFALEESDESYQARVIHTAAVLAEIVECNPGIRVIGLTEAPIKAADIDAFISACAKFVSLRDFIDSMTAEAFTPMGVALFADSKKFKIERLSAETMLREKEVEPHIIRSLQHRIQVLAISAKTIDAPKMIVVNTHFPFDAAKGWGEAGLLQVAKTLLDDGKPTLLMGDFNFDPGKLVKSNRVKAFIPERNNVLLDKAGLKPDTVDGILCSGLSGASLYGAYKERSHDQTMLLKQEYRLMRSCLSSAKQALRSAIDKHAELVL